MNKLKIFIFSLLLVLGSFCLIVLYYYFQVNKLKDHYPVWDEKNKDYKLISSKPDHWIDLKEIDKKALWAIVISEDWAFYEHPGIDFRQLKLVITESLKKGELVRGASTITQQMIKNALLSRKKILTRKAKEMLMALIAEKVLGKKKILEIYINLIELGKNIYGVKNASYHYFNKDPSRLNAKEGAFMAMLLPSPKRYSISFRKKELTDFAETQVQEILQKLKVAKIISEQELYDLLFYRLPFEKTKQTNF